MSFLGVSLLAELLDLLLKFHWKWQLEIKQIPTIFIISWLLVVFTTLIYFDKFYSFFPLSALIKSTGLRTDGKIDERSFWINHVSSLSVPLAVPLVYPRMVAIHDLDAKKVRHYLFIFLPISPWLCYM